MLELSELAYCLEMLSKYSHDLVPQVSAQRFSHTNSAITKFEEDDEAEDSHAHLIHNIHHTSSTNLKEFCPQMPTQKFHEESQLHHLQNWRS